MQEYRDGSYGKVKEGSELLKELANDPEEMAKTKAVHFGTREELEAEKVTGTNAKQIKRKLDQIERKLDAIIERNIIDSIGVLRISDGDTFVLRSPGTLTLEEIDAYGKQVRDFLQERGLKNVKVLVFENGISISVLQKTEEGKAA